MNEAPQINISEVQAEQKRKVGIRELLIKYSRKVGEPYKAETEITHENISDILERVEPSGRLLITRGGGKTTSASEALPIFVEVINQPSQSLLFDSIPWKKEMTIELVKKKLALEESEMQLAAIKNTLAGSRADIVWKDLEVAKLDGSVLPEVPPELAPLVQELEEKYEAWGRAVEEYNAIITELQLKEGETIKERVRSNDGFDRRDKVN